MSEAPRGRDATGSRCGSWSACLRLGRSWTFFNSSLPTSLRDSGDIPTQGELPETNATELKLAQVSARAAAPLAAVLFARHELRLAIRLDDHCRSCHLFSLFPKRHSQLAQKEPGLLVIVGVGDDGDVHPLRLVRSGHVDFREDEV